MPTKKKIYILRMREERRRKEGKEGRRELEGAVRIREGRERKRRRAVAG